LYEIGCKKIVSAGTCWEYGQPKGKVNENIPALPLKSIGSAKLTVSLLGRDLAKEKSKIFVLARLFFVFGPGQKKTSLIPTIIEAISKGKNPKIKNPKAANDFIYIDDVVRALCLLTTKNIESGIYNVGSGKLISVARIANYIFKKFDFHKKMKEIQVSQQTGFYADISKMRATTGWKPLIAIEEGINRMIEKF
jgi:nucleoside-diphosphate-sugar epimerase